MKYITLLLLTITTSTFAETYHAKLYDSGSKGTIAVDLQLNENWTISPNLQYGDYLLTKNKSVYATSTYMLEKNDDSEPISEADYLMADIKENRMVTNPNGQRVSYLIHKDGDNIKNIAFSRFLKDGVVFYLTMIPYPEFQSQSLQTELEQMAEMISTIKIIE